MSNDKNKKTYAVSATIIKELSDIESKITRVSEAASRAPSAFFTAKNEVAEHNKEIVAAAKNVAIDVQNKNTQEAQKDEASLVSPAPKV